MRKSFTYTPLLMAAALASSSALADTWYNWVGAGSTTETRGYVGLKWNLEGGKAPALVLGAVRAKVQANGDVKGADLSFTLNLAGGVKPAAVKLNFMKGKDTLQAEAGVGYDFVKLHPLFGLGANGPFLNGGVDFYNGGYDPFLGLTTLKRFDKPTSTACVDVGFAAFSPPDCRNVQ